MQNETSPMPTAVRTSSPLLRVKDAARALSVSERWIERRIASGELTAFRLGDGEPGRAPVRVDARDLAKLLRPVDTSDEPRAIARESELR